jgi:hypothetical protein
MYGGPPAAELSQQRSVVEGVKCIVVPCPAAFSRSRTVRPGSGNFDETLLTPGAAEKTLAMLKALS